jgi:hypothetical protein
MKQRYSLLAVALTGLIGCAAETRLVSKDTLGYSALRFRETVQTHGIGAGTVEFPAGTLLIMDRVRVSDGEPLYCGDAIDRGLGGRQTMHWCYRWHAPVLYLNAEYWKEGFARPMPPGLIEEIRLQ